MTYCCCDEILRSCSFSSFPEGGNVGLVLAALGGPTLVAGAVLSAARAVGPAATVDLDSEIGAGTHVKVFLPALERNEDGSVRGPLGEEPATGASALRGSPPAPVANDAPPLSQPDR